MFDTYCWSPYTLLYISMCVISFFYSSRILHTRLFCDWSSDVFSSRLVSYFFFFFQAEDGIRDLTVTGVQTCALPILLGGARKNGVSSVVRRPVRGIRGGARPQRSRRGRGTLPRGHPAGGERRRARVCRRPQRRHGRDPGRRVSRKLQLLLFVCGSAVFAYLVARIGVGHLLADAVRPGWLFVPIVLLSGVVCACNAGAWCLSMADEPTRPPFWRAYAITVASFSLNFMTPMVNVGGEPFKIAAVAPWLRLRRAAGPLGVYQILHTLGLLLSFLPAGGAGGPPR